MPQFAYQGIADKKILNFPGAFILMEPHCTWHDLQGYYSELRPKNPLAMKFSIYKG